jgi:DNA-binding transcriptional MerR regulator
VAKKLGELRNQKYVGAIELADEAARLVGRFVPRQERGSVTELPDERMVRYYSSGGLISPPESKQGTASVYGYLHLLQLLSIKRLQAEHLPIKKIKELVEDKTEHDLEQLLDVQSGTRQAHKAGNAARDYLESLLSKSSVAPAASPSAPHSAIGRAQITPSAWTRIVIDSGLELHIRDDYRLADDVREKQRLARRFLSEIENRNKQ